jgi:hypothetical protein
MLAAILATRPSGAGTISATIIGTSSVTAGLVGKGTLVSSITGSSSVSSVLKGSAQLSSSISGTSIVVAAVQGLLETSATITGTSTVSASIAGSGSLSVTISGAAVVDVSLIGSGTIAAVLSGTSVVDSILDGTGFLESSISGTSVASGSLVGTGTLEAQIEGTSSVTAQISGGFSNISATIVGTSTVTCSIGDPGPGYLVWGNAGVAFASISDGTLEVEANSNGYYFFPGLSGDITLTPSLTGYTFNPSQISITVGANTGNVNFEAATSSLAQSVVDSRLDPNSTFDIQDTQYYIVPSSDSRIDGPIQDSRTDVFVDSRVKKTLNSRD